MKMEKHVFAITPNPALDLSGDVENLKANEKAYVLSELRTPGGNAVNAARILARLKIPVLATGFLGGSTGEEIKCLLNEEKVRNKFVRIDGHSRISVTVLNKANSQQTRLSFLGPNIKAREREQLFKVFEGDRRVSLLVLGGALPKGFRSTDIIHFMRLAKKRGIESIIDCPASVLRNIVPSRPLLIKPNLDEFQELTRSNVRSRISVLKEARKMLKLVPYVCVSSVEGGALLVTRDGSYFGRIPKTKIKSTVGAGDSMVGAMAAQFHIGMRSGAELLRWGLAASAATLAHSGTAMGGAREIRRNYKVTSVEVLSERH
jgi:1-phosphofructokinase family hexose kinase